MIYYLLFPLLIFITSSFIKKKKFFLNKNQLDHQKFVNLKIPLIGGYFLIIPIIILFYQTNFFFSIIVLLTFILGIFSDFNILSSPKKRFFIQLLLILIFVLFKKIEVLPTRIDYIDRNFINTYWSYFFTVFCLMILVNGSNFIDGLNGLLLGYLTIILFVIYKLNLFSFTGINEDKIIFLQYAFLVVLIFNLFNQFFIGDSGAYSLSLFIGFLLIKIYSLNLGMSPYFIILLLWYPCFENLFSIIRKAVASKSILNADNQHLHQYIFVFLKKKLILKSLNANILSGILINLFNFVLIYIGSIYLYSTKIQLLLLLICIITYISAYIYIRKNFINSINSLNK